MNLTKEQLIHISSEIVALVSLGCFVVFSNKKLKADMEKKIIDLENRVVELEEKLNQQEQNNKDFTEKTRELFNIVFSQIDPNYNQSQRNKQMSPHPQQQQISPTHPQQQQQISPHPQQQQISPTHPQQQQQISPTHPQQQQISPTHPQQQQISPTHPQQQQQQISPHPQQQQELSPTHPQQQQQLSPTPPQQRPMSPPPPRQLPISHPPRQQQQLLTPLPPKPYPSRKPLSPSQNLPTQENTVEQTLHTRINRTVQLGEFLHKEALIGDNIFGLNFDSEKDTPTLENITEEASLDEQLQEEFNMLKDDI